MCAHIRVLTLIAPVNCTPANLHACPAPWANGKKVKEETSPDTASSFHQSRPDSRTPPASTSEGRSLPISISSVTLLSSFPIDFHTDAAHKSARYLTCSWRSWPAAWPIAQPGRQELQPYRHQRRTTLVAIQAAQHGADLHLRP